MSDAPTLHEFDSTGEAYDASQCDDSIKDGDVLVVRSEGVVGVLLGAWPVAVTPRRGRFHALKEDATWGDLKDYGSKDPDARKSYVPSYEAAAKAAAELALEPRAPAP